MSKLAGVLVIGVIIISFILMRQNKFSGQTAVRENVINEQVEKCLINLNGNSYDVEALRKIHPGGDIFECGSDMTEEFREQHGQDWERVKKYLIPNDDK